MTVFAGDVAKVCLGHVLGPSHIPSAMHRQFNNFAYGIGFLKK
jgi:hypothetical protein